jgi:NAD-dependent deacetylase
MIINAVDIVKKAELFVVVGTSLAVYPAAGLVNYAPWPIPKFIVDKRIPYTSSIYNLTAIEKPATEGIAELKNLLRSLSTAN